MLAATLLAGATACTPAELQALQALQGNVKNIDSVSGNVTVQLKDGSTTTFNFNDVKVGAIKQALGGLILEHGDNVTIKRDGEGRVREVTCRKAEVEGVIKSKVGDNVTITTDNNRDITLVTTSNTTFKIAGKTSPTFADLSVTQQVEATYDVTTMNALVIEVQTSDDTDSHTGRLEGTIKSIASDNKSIVVTGILKGDVTLAISTNTTIVVSGKGTNSVAGLRVGQRIKASYDVNSLTAIKILVVAGGKVQDNRGQQQRQEKDTGWNNANGEGKNNDK
jgi:hypothetical protein